MKCKNKDCICMEHGVCTLPYSVMLDEEGKCMYIERKMVEDKYEDGYEKEEYVDEKFLYE